MADGNREEEHPDPNRDDQEVQEETQEIWPGGPTQQDVDDGIWEWWDDVLYYVYNNDPRSACHYCTNHQITHLCNFANGRNCPCKVCGGLLDRSGCPMHCSVPGRASVPRRNANGRGRGGDGRGRGRGATSGDHRPAPRSDRRPAPRSAPRYNPRESGRNATHNAPRGGGRGAAHSALRGGPRGGGRGATHNAPRGGPRGEPQGAYRDGRGVTQDRRDAGEGDAGDIARALAKVQAELDARYAERRREDEALLARAMLGHLHAGHGGQNENGRRNFFSAFSLDHPNSDGDQSSTGGYGSHSGAQRARSAAAPYVRGGAPSASGRAPYVSGRGPGSGHDTSAFRGGRENHSHVRRPDTSQIRRDARREIDSTGGSAGRGGIAQTSAPRTDMHHQDVFFSPRNEARQSVGHNTGDQPTEAVIKQEPVEEDIKHEEEAHGRGDHSDHPGPSDRDYTQR